MRSITLLLLFTAALMSRAAHVPIANFPQSGDTNPEFIIHNWFVEDGLPHNGINNIVRDSRGFLWIGTLGGLARFDGRNFVEYPMPEEFARSRYNIRALAIEDENTILLLNAANKILRLRNGKYELHPANEHLANITPRDLAVDHTGAVWIGTDSPSIMRWSEAGGAGAMEIFGTGAGVTRRNSTFCFVSDENNRTWVAGGDFFGWYEDGELHRYEKQNPRSVMITKARAGGLWVASRDNLARFDTTRGTWNVVLSGKDWPMARAGLQHFYEGKDGVLWLATRRDGVLRLIDGHLKPLALRYDRVHAINEDINNDIWLGIYAAGLVHLKPNRHVILNSDAGLPMDVSTSVSIDETGALWCANQAGGLVRVENGEITVIKAPTRNMPFVINVCADQRGTIWVGTASGLYSTPVKADDGQRVLHHVNPALRGIQTLFCDSNGNLWLSWASSKFAVIKNGVVHEFTAQDGFPGSRVASIAERKTPKGREIWVAMEKGLLYQVRENAPAGKKKFIAQQLPRGARDAQLHTLFVDSENNLWLGTTSGLVLWRGAAPRLFTQADGLPDNIINQVIADGYGRLWVSSRRGIFHVSIKQLLAAADAPGSPVNATLFGRDDNLEGISGMVGIQPMAWKHRDGNLWFVTYRGVVGFDAVRPPETPRPLPVYIDGILVDGAPAPVPAKGPVHIGPGVGQLELHFAALDFSNPGRVRVRRILEGFDIDWNDATGELHCAYPNLRPGRYVFRVEAINGDGGASRAETSLVIIVAAAWWQTVWFRAILAFACVALVSWIALKVSNRLLKQRLRRLEHEHALERERTRIARDLHDELGGRVTKIGYIADSLLREDEPTPVKELAQNLVTQSHYLVEDLHGVVWTVNPQNDSWQQLAAYIVRYAQRHLAGTPILCTADGAHTIPDLPITPEARHNILSIAKEVLNNILKHSQAARATITMSVENERFRLVIADDGRGFDPNAPENNEGNGLYNMRTRMAEIGGRVDITSNPGNGSTITIDSPLKCRPPQYGGGANPQPKNPDATQSRHC
ncbi:signal transduction histidine kinase/ligand-binding sensor domain-containing protein [Ereboglobus sp. PH5-10]|uniref:sensor histidine kinase n=1 Tax=Ereboglobus sp. PH5-10 TaxID=2940629 RepID=UPI002406A1E6|nr:sensor histidine kinase [Ereboglobus sp. PH5-10]MDF9827609.1 signal transduction histidine kinase/ligand-binding sensor domain-containing protein [Ereboglobus sp. PH5-10]